MNQLASNFAQHIAAKSIKNVHHHFHHFKFPTSLLLFCPPFIQLKRCIKIHAIFPLSADQWIKLWRLINGIFVELCFWECIASYWGNFRFSGKIRIEEKGEREKARKSEREADPFLVIEENISDHLLTGAHEYKVSNRSVTDAAVSAVLPSIWYWNLLWFENSRKIKKGGMIWIGRIILIYIVRGIDK